MDSILSAKEPEVEKPWKKYVKFAICAVVAIVIVGVGVRELWHYIISPLMK